MEVIEVVEEVHEAETVSEAGEEEGLCLTVLDWQSRRKRELSHRLSLPLISC